MFSGRQLTLQDYVLIVWRRKWLLILPFVIIVLGTLLVSLSLPDIYRASTLILVEEQRIPEAFVSSTVSSSVRERLRTIRQQIESRTRLETVIRELHLVDNLSDAKALDAYLQKMRSNIEIEVKGPDSDAFTVSYMGEDPRTVMQVANKLAALFIEENARVREEQAIVTTEFLAEELQRVRAQLEEQEKAISEYKQRNMGELPGQQDANQRALDRLQLQAQANLEAIENSRRRKSLLVQQLSTLEPQETLGTDANSLEQQLARRRETLAELQRIYTEKYPDVIRLQQEIAELQTQLATNPSASPKVKPVSRTRAIPGSLRWRLEEEIHQIDIEVERLEGQLEHIREQRVDYEVKVANAARREQELQLLTRDYESTRKNYDSLLAREMQAKVSENLEKRQKAEQFRVLDPARVPAKPWKPDRLRILMMGLVLGVGLGAGAVLLAEYLDRSFHDPEDLKQFTALPVLTTIPFFITPMEEHQQQVKRRFLYAACVLVPAVTMVALYFFWMNIELLFARTLQLLTNSLSQLS